MILASIRNRWKIILKGNPGIILFFTFFYYSVIEESWLPFKRIIVGSLEGFNILGQGVRQFFDK